MAEDAAAFGIRLTEMRRTAGLSQEKLAERSGLSVRAIGNLERGRTHTPHPDSVRRLADALKLSAAAREHFLDAANSACRPNGAASPTGLPPATGRRSATAPRQLPAPVPWFVGRRPELTALDGLRARTAGWPGPAVAAITGPPGVGKTALAVHWARRAADQFPDGQLYLDLHGFGPSRARLGADEAIGALLVALGAAPEGWPPGVGARAGLYRSLAAGQRLLIVLDNARDAEQVRPLLPGSPGCLVLITSRASLAGLTVTDGAHLLSLDVLAGDEAGQLLGARLDSGRVAAEPGAVGELIGLCARLPLALAIVSARASARPGFPLAGLAAELRDKPGRLDALDAGDPASSVRAVFSWSFDQLSPAAARLFQLTGLHPGPSVTGPAAASLTRTLAAKTRLLLEELSRASLLIEQAPGRYSCHDLLRACAIEQAATLPSTVRQAALGRLLDYYLHTAAAADRLLYPLRPRPDLAVPGPGVTPDDLASPAQALAWLAAERRELAAAVALAADHGFDVHAWQLAFSLETFFSRRGHWPDWADTQHTALAAACRLGDRHAQILALCGIACAEIAAHQPTQAYPYLASALRLSEEANDVAGQIHVHEHTSRALSGQERFAEALAHSRQALRLAQAMPAPPPPILIDAFNQVGWFLAQLGRYQEALPYCRQAVALTQQLGEKHTEPGTLDSLAYVHWHLGHHDKAAGYYRRAVQLFDALGERYLKAETLMHAGDEHTAAGDRAAAQQAWTEALAIMEDLHHPDAEVIRAKLVRRGGADRLSSVAAPASRPTRQPVGLIPDPARRP